MDVSTCERTIGALEQPTIYLYIIRALQLSIDDGHFGIFRSDSSESVLKTPKFEKLGGVSIEGSV